MRIKRQFTGVWALSPVQSSLVYVWMCPILPSADTADASGTCRVVKRKKCPRVHSVPGSHDREKNLSSCQKTYMEIHPKEKSDLPVLANNQKDSFPLPQTKGNLTAFLSSHSSVGRPVLRIECWKLFSWEQNKHVAIYSVISPYNIWIHSLVNLF